VATDICKAIALTDFPCSPDVLPQYASQCAPKKGEIVGAVTQYRINTKTGEAVFCSHGGGCYPRYLTVNGQKVEALRLTNCKIGAREPNIPGVTDEGVFYDVEVDRSRNSAVALKYDDLDNALLALGMCSACAGNAAYISCTSLGSWNADTEWSRHARATRAMLIALKVAIQHAILVMLALPDWNDPRRAAV
jgi:hypothetical protein